MRLTHFLLIAFPLLFAGCTQPPIQDSKHFCSSNSDCVLSGSDPDGVATCVNAKWDEEWEKNPESKQNRWQCILMGSEACGCIQNSCARTDNDTGCGGGDFPVRKDSCEKQGGIWGKFGPAVYYSCALPTSDAGKECREDENDCQAGECLAKNLTQEQRADYLTGKDIYMTGQCSGWTDIWIEAKNNCLDLVDGGKYDGTSCAGNAPEIKKQCEALGGLWRKFSLMPNAPYGCHTKYKDGGRKCSDGGECEAKRCIIEGLTEEERENLEQNRSLPVTGRCPRWPSRAGCMDLVSNGRYDGRLCLD